MNASSFTINKDSTVAAIVGNGVSGKVFLETFSGADSLQNFAYTYDDSKKIKNWIYNFSDAIDGYMYLTVLNFGNRPPHLLTKLLQESTTQLRVI